MQEERTGCVRKIDSRVGLQQTQFCTCEFLTPLESFQLLQGTWPIGAQQSRQTAICENLAARLAPGTIIRLFVSVADAQNLFPAPWAWFAVAAVHSHAFAEGGDLLRKFVLRLGQQPVRP